MYYFLIFLLLEYLIQCLWIKAIPYSLAFKSFDSLLSLFPCNSTYTDWNPLNSFGAASMCVGPWPSTGTWEASQGLYSQKQNKIKQNNQKNKLLWKSSSWVLTQERTSSGYETGEWKFNRRKWGKLLYITLIQWLKLVIISETHWYWMIDGHDAGIPDRNSQWNLIINRCNESGK